MKRRIVFAGDSITHAGPWQSLIPDHFVTNFAIPGHTTSDLLKLVPDIVQSDPELLIVMIGTNDFGGLRLSEAQVANNIIGVATEIKENLPNIPVIWHSLTPRSDEFSESMVTTNYAIRPELEKLNFTFLNIYPELKEKNQNKLEVSYCEDPETFGLHLNATGYQKWFEVLGPLISKILSEI